MFQSLENEKTLKEEGRRPLPGPALAKTSVPLPGLSIARSLKRLVRNKGFGGISICVLGDVPK